ncbi:heavy metal translocating P-type ATPase [Vannielia litorea]|uniref:Cu+-exporting ATPase n=1 Tax=Vannielia litorea TaxID=1217970 RepID=A0A1N6E9J2_9RHOB|nr:heavy metal translocating P-type ATPase [Vannielia litorea]SIN79698.1 Cu+-exporting ATPase [Vannielia litorea]
MRDTPVANARLTVSGMTCGKCSARVEAALLATPGVQSATVTRTSGEAITLYDPSKISPEALAAAVTEAGYPATPEARGDTGPAPAEEPGDEAAPAADEPRQEAPGSVTLTIENMHCASCVGTVEKALSAVPGVTSATVNLATRRATVHGVAKVELLENASKAAGYPATAHAHHHDASPADTTDETRIMARRTLVAALLTAPVFLIEMGGHLYPPLHHWVTATLGVTPWRIVQFLLTTAVLAGPGRLFFTSGIPALLRRAPEMNALVALGAGAAWAYSTFATFAPGLLPASANHVYFEAAAVIVTLILLGRTLEARARGQAGAALRGLMALTPKTAPVETSQGIQDKPVSEIAPGDVLHLSPGARVAVDGVVTEGSGWLDESMVTGESAPVEKAPGDPLTGGTLNGTTALTYRATAIGADTVLARIAAQVEQAQATKLPVQRIIDKVTAVFVPAVLVIAALTVAVWLALTGDISQALVAGVSVLIIACPCAMGLATPVSILVATGRAAELGVIFRQGAALEQLGAVKTLAFDKTGTLTEGHPRLTSVTTAGDDRNETLRLAASAEARSEHPLAKALVSAAEAEGIELSPASDAAAKPGYGLAATVEGKRLIVGGKRAMEAESLTIPAVLTEALDAAETRAETAFFLAVDGTVAALFTVSDPIKPDAAPALQTLKAQGVSLALLSGDAPRVAEAVARDLAIDSPEGGLLPADKLARIEALKSVGPVGFVGDGINDAPALAAADVGLAIGTGTEVAVEAADVVLLSGRLSGLTAAHEISRRAMVNIRQNLAWAFGYNILLIPVAAGVLVPFGGPQLSPMLAAGAMALSSLAVVANALRLRRAAR